MDAALRAGVARASKTLKYVKSMWIKDQSVVMKNGKITEYQVLLKVTFILN
jgi:flavin-binding protein dodecin